MLEVFAQFAVCVTFASHLPQSTVALIDNTAGQAALSKGYGKDIRDGSSSSRGSRPRSINVADAVSWDDFARARPRGWTRVHGPHDEILNIFARAAGDLEFATAAAGDGGCRMRPGTG